MELPTGETLWRIIAGCATAVMSAVLGAFGFQFRQYRKDRHTLHELKRKMFEVDGIRRYTDDGRKAIEGMQDVQRRMGSMEFRQDQLERNQHDMQLVNVETNTYVKMIATKMDLMK